GDVVTVGACSSAHAQEIGAENCVIIKVGIGAKRKHLRTFHPANQKKSNRTGATPAHWKAGAAHQGHYVHQAMRAVLDTINSTGRNTVTGPIASIFHVQSPGHGVLRLRRLFPELRRWLDFATGRYTTSRVPSCKIRFRAPDEGCSLYHCEIRVF